MRAGSARADSGTIQTPAHAWSVVSGFSPRQRAGLSGQPWTVNMVIDHDHGHDLGQGSSSKAWPATAREPGYAFRATPGSSLTLSTNTFIVSSR